MSAHQRHNDDLPAEQPLGVLVVEDDEDTRANMRDILELDDYQVQTAGSVAEAFARHDWEAISVVILDRKLPDGEAHGILPRLQAVAPHAAVIVVTGFADLAGAIEALRAGADDYLLKPVNADLLRRALARVAERRRLADAKNRSEMAFQNLVEAAGCMIVILRPDLTIAYLSPFGEQLTGVTAQEVAGKDFFQLVPKADQQRTRAVFDRTLQGVPQTAYEGAVVRRDGTRRTLLWNWRRLDHYEDQPVVLAVGQDITSLKEAQDTALRSERLAAIGQMITGLAHESRNALQRIQACSELLELEVGQHDEALSLVKRIQNAQDQMHRLFDEVRNYAAPIRLELQYTSLASAWREAWELLLPHRQARQAELKETLIEQDLQLVADHFRLVQVFRNLLENSLAACSDPVELHVQCSETRLQGKAAVSVTVVDNGPGLSPEQAQRIFEPFYTTKTKGTGLGMPIAQRIIEAHGGTITVANRPDCGAQIRIVLPREQA